MSFNTQHVGVFKMIGLCFILQEEEVIEDTNVMSRFCIHFRQLHLITLLNILMPKC